MKEKLLLFIQNKEIVQFSLIILITGICVGIVLFIKKHRKIVPEHFDTLEGHEFEYYCAELLRKKGFIDVEVTKGSGDYGADILAEKDGVTYAIQCKCYTAPIGVKAIQEAYAGRDYYDRMVNRQLHHPWRIVQHI